MQAEERLNDRVSGRRAQRLQCFNQFLERKVLARECFDEVGPNSLQEGLEGRVAAEISAECQVVDEHSDQRMRLPTEAIGRCGAGYQVRLAGVAEEEDLEGSRHDHERRC